MRRLVSALVALLTLATPAALPAAAVDGPRAVPPAAAGARDDDRPLFGPTEPPPRTRADGYRRGRHVPLLVIEKDGRPVEEHTAAAFDRMREAAARDGVLLGIVSGFRTMREQVGLWLAYRAGWGTLAAHPGHSTHQSGRALDLNTAAPSVLAWLEAHAREYGFRRTVPSEPWHWELATARHHHHHHGSHRHHEPHCRRVA